MNDWYLSLVLIHHLESKSEREERCERVQSLGGSRVIPIGINNAKKEAKTKEVQRV